MVGLLIDGLVERGHDVTLFASGDSLTAARLVSVCPSPLRGTARHKGILNLLSVIACLEREDQFDIIHNHTEYEGMAMAGVFGPPVLTTLHGSGGEDWLSLFAHYSGWYNTVSKSAKLSLPEKERFAGVVYNSIDVASYPFNGSTREDHLLFLGRMSFEKGPHLAIQVAKQLKRQLVLAGNVDSCDEEYFRTRVLPEVDGDQIQYVGGADYFQKRELLLRPHCLLAPITWPEPFGLFMAEAMACGTPVVALNRGSAPEVVKHGETGFVVETLDEMANAVEEIDRIDRSRCRYHVLRNFDAPRMVDDYLAAYEDIVSVYHASSRIRRSQSQPV